MRPLPTTGPSPQPLARRIAAAWLGVAVLVALPAAGQPANSRSPAAARATPVNGVGDLIRFDSRHYTIQTNLARDEALPLAQHLDAVFDEYDRRFSAFRPRDQRPMALYLLRTREHYTRFLAQHGLESGNTGGMFFIQPRLQGLATWVEDRPRSQTLQVLQHEGFHQFAHSYIGPNLPIWINEGLAQYFEDGILVNGTMHLGIVNATRLVAVRDALNNGNAVDFDHLLRLSDAEWTRTLNRDPERSSLLYDQAWAVAYFLIHGDDNRYRAAFEQFLLMLSKGEVTDRAFRKAFGSDDTGPFRRRWEWWVGQVRPDPLSAAVTRLEVLGEALAYLREQGIPSPASTADLRRTLQHLRFYLERTRNGVVQRYDAKDESLYRYRDGREQLTWFQLLPAERADLPPRLTAAGLTPTPTIVFYRDARGKVVQDIVYR